MAKSVYDGFMIVLSRLEPKPHEVAARKSHKKTIEQGLASEFAAYNNIKEMGSHTRDSAIHIFSDVDYLATLGRDDVTWGGKRVSSYTTLARVKSALDARFAQTDVWADGPAIVVGFGQGSGAVDVVPAIYLGPVNANGDGYPLFEVPDGDGWWRPSSPPRCPSPRTLPATRGLGPKFASLILRRDTGRRGRDRGRGSSAARQRSRSGCGRDLRAAS